MINDMFEDNRKLNTKKKPETKVTPYTDEKLATHNFAPFILKFPTIEQT